MQGSLRDSWREAQARLVVQTADLPLGTLADMVESGAIDLQPGFQRRERWSIDKQAALIESFLLNVPVPPVYLAEEDDGTYTAIDGKQRLRAIADYIYGRLTLKNLERLTEAEGVLFSQLPLDIQNSLRLRPFLRVVTLLKQTDPLLKYEVFLRLNRGGESLNNQEIRNVAFRGQLNDTIYLLSENPFLRQRLKIDGPKSSAYRDMDDAEYVLRFLTLKERYQNFSGDLAKEMDEFMRKNQSLDPWAIGTLSADFDSALSRCKDLWGDNSFRRPDGNGWRDQTLAGMYDAQMIAAFSVTPAVIAKGKQNPAAVLHATKALFAEDEFDKSVRTGTNTPQRIRYRIAKMREMLEAL